MVNKKGWLRIVEVTISVILIITSVFIFYQTQTETPRNYISDYVTEQLKYITDDVSVRQAVFDGQPQDIVNIENSVESRIKRSDIDFDVEICDADQACAISNRPLEADFDGNIYVFQKIISLPELDPASTLPIKAKKLKIYYWSIG